MAIDFRKLDHLIAGNEVMHTADKIGIHYVTLYKILRGEMDPNYLTGLALAECCGWTLDELAGRRRTFPAVPSDRFPIDALGSETRRDLAGRLRCSPAYLSDIALGKKTPSCSWIENASLTFRCGIHPLATALRNWQHYAKK